MTIAKKKVLLIEDDPDTRDIVTTYLNTASYHVAVAGNSKEGLRLLDEIHPHLVLLDIMLPGLNGLEICRQIREQSRLPVIMLTALIEPDDRLAGFSRGADDYITKPFDPRELVARVQAVLRRFDPELVEGTPQYLSCGDVTMDLRTHQVTVLDNPIRLTPTEMRLLSVLMAEQDRVFTKEQLIENALSSDSDAVEHTVDNHVSNLRKKLEEASGISRHIRTVRGVGYTFSHE